MSRKKFHSGQVTNPASGVTKFGYDANDNLVSITDPRSLITSYGYNGFGDLLSQQSPDTGSTTNTFDSGGNLATSTDARGAVSTYTYDAQRHGERHHRPQWGDVRAFGSGQWMDLGQFHRHLPHLRR
jgi:YD repeat-containing protein